MRGGVLRRFWGMRVTREVATVRVDALTKEHIGCDVTLERTLPGWEVLLTGTLREVADSTVDAAQRVADPTVLEGDKALVIGCVRVYVDDDEELEVTLP